MERFLGLTSIEWAAVGSAAGVASFLAAVLIAAFVQAASTRAASAARLIDRSVAGLTRRSRRDEVMRQLRDGDNVDHLQLLVKEGRQLTIGYQDERAALEKVYYANPATPLISGLHDLPMELDRATQQ